MSLDNRSGRLNQIRLQLGFAGCVTDSDRVSLGLFQVAHDHVDQEPDPNEREKYLK